ncbi:MAG TPA: aminoacyl-tRNA hydrolase [Bacteroidaceae bacterium]|nr:aminoacyl-tRNA hydrolase [Bacteroidaceae bacterium]
MTDDLLKEVRFKTTRSSGPGGQHVNKTESRVELHWNVEESLTLNENERELIKSRLKKRISEKGEIILASEKYRSQLKNREDVSARFIELINRSLKPAKKRKPTRPTGISKERRLREKKQRGELKRLRGRMDSR